MTDNTKFQLKTFTANDDEVFHVARTTINSQKDIQVHKHGYGELFWIKEGKGIHLVNGKEVPIKKGTLCMIRPNDSHSFKLDRNQDSLVITNIAFGKDSLKLYQKRYFETNNTCFWTTDELPFSMQLDADQLNKLSVIVDRAISLPRNTLELDNIMIHVFRLVNVIKGEQEHIPHWLAYAIENYNTPDKFKDGIQGFVNLTDKSIDHVNRVLQKHLKQTLTQTVIKARLQYASHQLGFTNASIKSICFDCGFESISYFYRIFKKHIGYTPVEFRNKNQRIF